MIRVFDRNSDYKTAFERAVTELIGEAIEDRSERMDAIQRLTDKYIQGVGEKPDGRQIERLTDYTLREELSDPSTWKAKHTEYPFFSESQTMRRTSNDIGLHNAEEVGSDGMNHRPPIRKVRSKRDLRFVDKATKSRNAARRLQYRIDTEPGPVIEYNLADMREAVE